jgi:hypothetical protein
MYQRFPDVACRLSDDIDRILSGNIQSRQNPITMFYAQYVDESTL